MTAPTPSADTIAFAIGDEVFHRSKREQMGIILSITFGPGFYTVRVSWGPMETNDHYPFELTKERGFES